MQVSKMPENIIPVGWKTQHLKAAEEQPGLPLKGKRRIGMNGNDENECGFYGPNEVSSKWNNGIVPPQS